MRIPKLLALGLLLGGLCPSLYAQSSATDFFRTRQDGVWTTAATWESSPDGIAWINATLAPTVNSAGVRIQAGDSVSTTAALTIDQTVVEAGGILRVGPALTIADGTGDDLIIEGRLIQAGTGLPVFTGTLRVKTGGIVRNNANVGNGTMSIYASSTNTYYEDGAVFEWNSPNATFSPTNGTFFPNAAANEMPIFRTISTGTFVTTAVPLVINGIYEQHSTNFTFGGSNATPTIIRNGIRIAAGCQMVQTNLSPKLLITGDSAVFEGPGTLFLTVTPTGGLICTAPKVSNNANFIVSNSPLTTGGHAEFSGSTWYGNGHTITGTNTAEIQFSNGATVTGQTTFQRMGSLDGTSTIVSGPGNMQTVTQYCALRGGTLNTNNNLTFASTATGTAYLNDFTTGYTGTISGNIHMQRYIPLGMQGFRMLGTPVAMASISGVTGFTPSGTAGFIIPDPSCNPNYVASNSPYGNWMQLVENATPQFSCGQSLFEVLTGGGMTNGRGYYMDVPGTSTLTFTGAPNTGIVSFPLTHANAAVSNGWNMVSNPYPSPLAWELVNVPPGVDAIGKIWQTSGAYMGTWQDLDPNSAGTQAVAIGQAFQVRATVPGVSVPFLVDNLNRTTTAPTYLLAGGDPMTLNIDIQGNGFADLAKVRFMDGATTAMDAQFDSPKMLSNNNQPMVYSVWNNQAYSTNSFGTLTQVQTLPLGVNLAQAGEHTLVFSNLDQFPASTMVYLEDTQTGTAWQNLRVNDTYTFTEGVGAHEGRFILHFYPPVAHNSVDATCDSKGALSLNNEAPLTWNYTLTDAQNQTVGQGTLQGAQTIGNLPAGTYTLSLTETVSGYIATETVSVSGVQAVTAQAAASAVNVETGEEIQFTATGNGANAWQWNFGDQNTSAEQNPVHAYNAAGTYTVSLTAANSDCETTASFAVTVGTNNASLTDAFTQAGVRLWNNGNEVYLSFNQAWEGQTVFTLYDLQGRTVYQKQLADANGTLSMDCGTLTAGTYTAELRHTEQTLTRKLVMGL